MRTIAIINQKGGCGKTTSSINLAACLARLGNKTLLVDVDPQGHCGVGLAVPEEQIERTIFNCLIEDGDGKTARVPEVVWQIASDFDLAPSNIQLAAFEQLFAGRPGREERLKQALDPVSGRYKWCIIDCPPSVGLLTFNALHACDEVLVPVETGFFSLHGLGKMMETLDMLRQQCGRDIPVRIVPTQYDTRTKLAREVLSELRSKFRERLTHCTINFNTKLKEAASFGQPITEYDPASRGYKDFVALARELMGSGTSEVDVLPPEQLSRPAELVQRARQLAQLANVQFGRTELEPAGGGSAVAEAPVAVALAEAPVAVVAEPEISDEQREAATEQKIRDFYGVRQIGASLVFATRFESASQVSVAGDFNGWSAQSNPMQPGARAGEFRCAMDLRPGRYLYRLVVDGRWTTDPHNQYVESNQFGELNNVVEVE
jgi:chromosome partitioning protein